MISTQTQAAVAAALANLRRTEGVNIAADQTEEKAVLDALVADGLALTHKYDGFHYYEPVQARPEAFVPWPWGWVSAEEMAVAA